MKKAFLTAIAITAIVIMFGSATIGGFTVQEVGDVDGKAVQFYTITNKNGMEVTFSNYGATICSVKVPDRNGNLEECVLGWDTLDGYKKDDFFFGMVVGRYGNRIGKARFTLNGVTYNLDKNDGDNILHGGSKGFKTKVFDAKVSGKVLALTYVSPDGEMGFPGTLKATVRYTLTNNNEIDLQFSATTDKDTVVNLTNHSYWNLNGNAKGDILGHQLIMNADRFTPTDANLIPTGEFTPVAGTPMDFQTMHTLGERINANYPAIKIAGGYDHNFMFPESSTGFRKVVDLYSPASGRRLEILTDQPGTQMYTGSGLKHTGGHGGASYGKYSGVAFETQFPPDAPNHPNFPSTVLKPGKTYKAHTIFKLSAS